MNSPEFINTVDLGTPSGDGKVYYRCVVDLLNSEVFLAINASCDAAVDKWLCDQFKVEHYLLRNRFRHFFLGSFEAPDGVTFERLPKKYHKYLP